MFFFLFSKSLCKGVDRRITKIIRIMHAAMKVSVTAVQFVVNVIKVEQTFL
jgi:hypothetical protein